MGQPTDAPTDVRSLSDPRDRIVAAVPPVPAITEHRLTLTGLRSGDAPATWGQRAIWHRMRTAGLGVHTYNLSQQVAVPAGLPTAAVLDALGQLVERYDALRTRQVGDEPADLRQHLPASDALVVEVCEADGDDLATVVPALSERLAATRFDPTVDLGLRALIVTARGVPRTVLMTLSHQAVDLSSSRVVAAELVALLAARARGGSVPEPASARQPLEQAVYESSADGARLSANALRHWQSQLETVPSTPFPVTYPPQEVRFWRGALRSTALATAADVLAVRYRSSTSTIVLAAHAIALGRVTGNPGQPLMLLAGNRFTAALRSAVGSLAQPVLATVDLTGPSFATVVRQTWSAVAVACRNGQYDPTRLGDLERELKARGTEPDVACYFSDLRTDTRARRDRPSTVAADTIRAASADTTFRWLKPWPEDRVRSFLYLREEDDAMVLLIVADTSVLPPEQTRTVLYDIERLLVAEASGV